MQTAQQNYNEDDKINLFSLFKLLSKYKIFIIFVTAVSLSLSIYIIFSIPVKYKAEVLLLPSEYGNSSNKSNSKYSELASFAGLSTFTSGNSIKTERALKRLKTRGFLTNYIREQNLKPVLFADSWSKSKQDWINNEPTDIKASNLLAKMISVIHDYTDKSGSVTLLIEWENPDNPSKISDIANNLVHSINQYEKEGVIYESKKSINFLKKELNKTDLVESRLILNNLIGQEVSKITIANVRDDFVFRIIDPAINPKESENKPVLIIIIIGLLLGIFIGSFVSVSFDYYKNLAKKA